MSLLSFGNNKVFIVEDDVSLYKAYEEMLTTQGFKVTGTTIGSEALLKIPTEKPKLILLDIMLVGGTNGLDILSQIKSDPDTKNIPVIILTNLDSEEKTARDMGAEDYLVKANVSRDEIIGIVKKYVK